MNGPKQIEEQDFEFFSEMGKWVAKITKGCVIGSSLLAMAPGGSNGTGKGGPKPYKGRLEEGGEEVASGFSVRHYFSEVPLYEVTEAPKPKISTLILTLIGGPL